MLVAILVAILMGLERSRGICDTGETRSQTAARTVQHMISTNGIRFAALALSVAAGVGLVGCGNGVEVRGPSKPSSAPVSSPSSAPASSDSPSVKASHAPDGSSGQGTTKPSSAPGHSRTTGGSHNGGNQAGGSQAGGNQAGDAQTSAPPDKGGQQQSGGATIARCGLGDLRVGVRVPAGGGAAGSQYVLLTFTNTSQQPCTMYGYAGVSFVGHQDGTQLGKPAVRDRSRSSATVRVAPGNTRAELLQITDAGNYDPKTCQPTTSDGFRVYPPESYTAAYVPFKTAACQGDIAQLTVYPVGTRS